MRSASAVIRLSLIEQQEAKFAHDVIYAVITVLAELPININEPTIFILIKTVLPLIFSYFVFRFHGGIYRLIGLWCLYDLLENILLTGVATIADALRLLILFFVIVLTFYIARKVFPNLKVLGEMKKGSSLPLTFIGLKSIIKRGQVFL